MKPVIDKYQLLVKKLNNNLTKEDSQLLDKELNVDQQFHSNYKVLENFWNKCFTRDYEENQKNIYAKVMSGILNIEPQKRPGSRLKYWVAASVFLLFANIATLLYYINGSETELRYYSTLDGESKEIVLDDSTVITLKESSLLIAPETFGSQERNVTLVGEAFFKVSENKKKPFSIKTSHLTVSVLGTEFNVSAYQEEKLISTYLKEGSVQLKGDFLNSKDVIMQPEQLAILNKEDMQLEVVDEIPYNNWSIGSLNFKNKPLKEIILLLSEKYSIDISLQDTIVGNQKYTGYFKDESIFEILGILSLTKPFKYELEDEIIVIRSE